MKTQMRTIDQLYEHIKNADPESAITKTAIRRLVTTGTIPSVKIGAKYIVSVEAVESFLASGKAG